LAWSRYALAFLLLALSDLAQARRAFEEALVQLRQQDMPFGVFCTLLALGYTLFEQGDVAGVEARLWGATEALRETTGERGWHVFKHGYDRALAAARTQVSAVDWAAAWAAGRALTTAQALAEALEATNTTPGSDERLPLAANTAA